MLLKSDLEPLISVIIINHNGLSFLDKCITSIMNSDYPRFEVILVDNASDDGSVEFVKKSFGLHKITVVQTGINIGPSAARNIGSKYANGDFLVFLDADTYVDKNCLNEMVRKMRKAGCEGACQCKILSMESPFLIDSIGGRMDLLGFGYADMEFANSEVINTVREIFIAKGTCICIKRKVFEEVEGFDESFFIFYEENDICWRIWLSGYSIIYVPTAIIFHAGSKLSPAIDPYTRVFCSTRNALITLIKNYELSSLFKFAPLHIAARMAEIVVHLALHQKSFALAKFNALIFVFTHLNKIIERRYRVQYGIKKVSEKEIRHFFVKPNLSYLVRNFKKLWLTKQDQPRLAYLESSES